MNHPDPKRCLLQSSRDGKIKILSCPETAEVSREIIERFITLHNAAMDLKLAKGRHHTQLASEKLYSLLP